MIEKFSTGIEGLDQLTDGGFIRGSAYIVQGPPGAGKTILANQFCYAHVRYLSVIKLRDSDFDPRTLEFHVDAGGIAFGPDPRAAVPVEEG